MVENIQQSVKLARALTPNDVVVICDMRKIKVLEKDPVGSKVLERNVCVSNSEIKAEKEQPDHEVFLIRIK